MRRNTRDLLSISALAIAAMAIFATNVDAQCPGGCFGYPTPTQPSYRTFAPVARHQPAVQVFPAQTFVQSAPYVSAQQFAQPQLAPAMAAPIEQTFLSQPIIVSPLQTMGMPEYYPQPFGSALPASNYYPPSTGVISSGQIFQPIILGPIESATLPIVDPANSSGSLDSGIEKNSGERVQEGQIEGEIISSDDDLSALKMTPGEIEELDFDNKPSTEKKPESFSLQGDIDEIPSLSAKEVAEQEKADKAAELKAEEEKAAKEQVTKRKAEKLEAEKAKAEADEKKAAQEDRKMAEPKVESNAEKITRLETSLKRQIKRAKQISERHLAKKLVQLKADDASESEIAIAKEEAADALENKIESIETRVQSRIEKLAE